MDWLRRAEEEAEAERTGEGENWAVFGWGSATGLCCSVGCWGKKAGRR
jgi:hypothetical protein